MLEITEQAALQISKLPNKALRLTVSGGGCAGFQYIFTADIAPLPDDVIITKDEASIITDAISLDLLSGSIVDYETTLMGSMYKIKNPNAKSACGCGNSFSV